MSKKHKKPSPVLQQKLLTAHNRNEFIRKLQHVLFLMSGDTNTIKLIPVVDINCMFDCRFVSPRVMAAEGQDIDNKVLHDIKCSAQELMRSETIPLNIYGGAVTYEEYLTVCMTLFHSMRVFLINAQTFKFVEDLSLALEPFDRGSDFAVSASSHSTQLMKAITVVQSDLASNLYWTKIDANEPTDAKPESFVILRIFKHTQEKIQATIEGLVRPIVRVGWGDYEKGMQWCSRPPASFGLPQRDITHLLPVYIQMHALQRMAERLDCIDRGTVHYFVVRSVNFGRIHKGQNGHYLIEFHFLDMKAGYLLAKVHDDMIIIRTFLFLTNNGTPEGQKLEQLTGLRKHDKKYLALDKLSTFMDPQLRENEPIQRLFFDAGCSDLFEITQDLVHDSSKIRPHVTEKVLLDYLMLQPKEVEIIN